MKDRVKQKDFFVYWKPGSQNMGDYFTKHHPPHHHNKIDQKIVHKWDNYMQTPIHTVAVTSFHKVAIRQNRTVLQGCANAVHKYGHTNTKTVT